jgi:ubiquitin C-terminal hydrolase
MNSALQCLFHCVPVLCTFLSGAFIVDLNVDNPLGKGGEMATAFGSLLQKVWRGEVDFVNPEGFKHILGKHAVQFQSYDQHDSQEFLSYLLDMLHEDLNRVKQKPYIEEADDEGRPDEEVARECWENYR